MRIGNRDFNDDKHTYVWGILNVTPDSFSDGGKWDQLDKALFHVEKMIAQGADLIDLGGESIRPGYVQLSEEEEIARVIPVLEQIKKNFDIPISLDTYKGGVAYAGICAGADLINDIWSLQYDEKLVKVIAEGKLPCCLMHNRKNQDYHNFLEDVYFDLQEAVNRATAGGIAEENIILDPGVGFAKTYEQNLEIINHLEKFQTLGYPILLGCSRKSVIGITLGLPAEQREEGTLVTTVFGVTKGCRFVRVHDVEKSVRAIKMTEAILRG